MLHKMRHWSITSVASAEELATKLTKHRFALCTGFSLEGYLFLNDSTSEDGAQEYAVVKPLPEGGHAQVKSITFGWRTRYQVLEMIRKALAGEYDTELTFASFVELKSEPGRWCRCPYCG